MVITMRRLDGNAHQIHAFKKGYKVRSMSEAETYLWKIGMSVPVGEQHRVAYEVELDGIHYYGTLTMPHKNPQDRCEELTQQLFDDYGVRVTSVR